MFGGGDKRDRTADLLHAMQALSQLSYTPIISRPNCYCNTRHLKQSKILAYFCVLALIFGGKYSPQALEGFSLSEDDQDGINCWGLGGGK